MLRQLGHWVEANCNDDPTILQSSGFEQQATPVRGTPPQPLDGPPSFKLVNGKNSGHDRARHTGFEGRQLHGALCAAGAGRQAGNVDGNDSGNNRSFYHR